MPGLAKESLSEDEGRVAGGNIGKFLTTQMVGRLPVAGFSWYPWIGRVYLQVLQIASPNHNNYYSVSWTAIDQQ